jgi:iron(III) transport system permease protein
VELPLARGAMLTAGLIVFIDILKELPATLILRPFNFDTLAVIAHNYAIDERLPQAGPPSLLIHALSLPAVIWLTAANCAGAPGTRAERWTCKPILTLHGVTRRYGAARSGAMPA